MSNLSALIDLNDTFCTTVEKYRLEIAKDVRNWDLKNAFSSESAEQIENTKKDEDLTLWLSSKHSENLK